VRNKYGVLNGWSFEEILLYVVYNLIMPKAGESESLSSSD
jgi:hypothetical protein